MKHYILIILFFVAGLSAYAQENRTRAESLAAMAIGKEAEGGTMDEVSAIFAEAVKAAPSYAELYPAWGYIAMTYAEKNSDPGMCELSFEKFAKAEELNLKTPELYSLWAGALLFYAQMKDDESIYPQAFEKLQKAVDINPEYIEANLVWGQTLLKMAIDKNDAALYRQSVEKFDKVLQVNADLMDANLGKGRACLRLGKLEKDHNKYGRELITSYLNAEKQGSQLAAYNLACYYSLAKEKDEACKWLERSIVKQYTVKMDWLNRKFIEDDEDFSNIRRDKKYKEIISAYYGK